MIEYSKLQIGCMLIVIYIAFIYYFSLVRSYCFSHRWYI